MIDTVLNVKDYCDNCHMLNPVANAVRMHDKHGSEITRVYITCKYKEHCDNLIRLLHKKG